MNKKIEGIQKKFNEGRPIMSIEVKELLNEVTRQQSLLDRAEAIIGGNEPACEICVGRDIPCGHSGCNITTCPDFQYGGFEQEGE